MLTLVFHDQAESITEAVTGYEARLARADLPNIPFHSEPLINGHKDYANLGISQRKAMLAYFSSFVRKLPISYTTFAYRRSEFADLDKLTERMRRDISEERGAPMPLGYAGHARLEVADDEIAIYSYTGENWNVRDEGARNALESEEGQFTISKSCLVELAMRRKVKRLPNGRRGRVEKAIVRHSDLAGMMDRGDIVVDKLCGVDTEAFGYRPCIYRCLLRHIFESYQLNGRLPETEGFVM